MLTGSVSEFSDRAYPLISRAGIPILLAIAIKESENSIQPICDSRVSAFKAPCLST